MSAFLITVHLESDYLRLSATRSRPQNVKHRSYAANRKPSLEFVPMSAPSCGNSAAEETTNDQPGTPQNLEEVWQVSPIPERAVF
jgi:hypothetical protein